MGLRWADRADPSWQHFKDHLSGPHRGAMCLDLGVWASVPLFRTPLTPHHNQHHPAPPPSEALSQVLLFLVPTSLLCEQKEIA